MEEEIDCNVFDQTEHFHFFSDHTIDANLWYEGKSI